MNLSRLGSPPVEHFINPSDETSNPSDPPVNNLIKSAAILTNVMDQRQFRTAIGILVGVSLLSTLFGSLIMYCASFSKLLMISKLTTDSVQEERYITERLFEKINPSVECQHQQKSKQ